MSWVTLCCLVTACTPFAPAITDKPTHLLAAQNRATGTQLWQTDHTPAGTYPLSYLNTGTATASSQAYPIGTVSKWGLFAAYTPETGQELWRTDGTTAGTTLLKDLVAGERSSLPSLRMIYTRNPVVGSYLLFWSMEADRLLLNRTDGSASGTQTLARFPYSVASGKNVDEPTLHPYGQQALFWVVDDAHGLALWRSDGTAAGTRLVIDPTRSDPKNDTRGLYPVPLLSTGDEVYFISPDTHTGAYDHKPTHSLWRISDTQSDTSAEHLHRFPAKQGTAALLAANGKSVTWLQTYPSDQRPELWHFDLASQRATQVYHFAAPRSAAQSASSGKPLWFQGQLYFWLDTFDDKDRAELWRTDLTPQGTQRLLSLPSPNGEYKTPPFLFSFAGRLYFFANDGVRPAQLWISDGTPRGTKQLLAASGYQYAGGAGDGWPSSPAPYWQQGDRLVFPTFSRKGREYSNLWGLSAAAPEKPFLLGEFADPELLPPSPNDPHIHFLSAQQRWQTDGTVAGTRRLGKDPIRADWKSDIWSSGSSAFAIALPMSPPRWLLIKDEPWLLESDPAASRVLKDINTTPASQDLGQTHAVGSGWYFKRNQQLWFAADAQQPAQAVGNVPATETLVLNAYPLAAVVGDSLYFITENTQKQSTLWQAKHGQATRLQTLPTQTYLWLFPGKDSVYLAHFDHFNTAWRLLQWKTGQPQAVAITSTAEHPKTQLTGVLETKEGLLYTLVTTDNRDLYPKDRLWWQAHASQPSQALDIYIETLSFPKPLLLSTNNQVLVLQEHPKDTLSRRLFRLNTHRTHLEPVPMPPLSERTFLRATPNGLYVLTDTRLQSKPPAPLQQQLWFLPDPDLKPRLLHTFSTEQKVELTHTQGKLLYFNVRRYDSGTDDSSSDAWVSSGTPESTQRFKEDLELLLD